MIEIVECGPLNTVQDMGRFGLRSIGIGTSGAMDPLALRVANILAGNEEGSAGIEIQTFPFRVRFSQPTRFAVTGADAQSTLADRALPPWWSAQARPGQELTIFRPADGARAYLALDGGVDTAPVMGSRSTSLRNAFGGHGGRALRAGDSLPIGQSGPSSDWEAGAMPPPRTGETVSIRAITGAEFPLLPRHLQDQFWSAPWTITPQSDRGGYRLRGPDLQLVRPLEMRSYGVVSGIVQLPPSGQPIIQLSDANTAGGYPRLAGVIEADLWRLGQASIGTQFTFIEVDFDTAQQALTEADGYLDALRQTFGALHIATGR